MKNPVAKVCPKCRSKNIFIWMGAQVGIIYECKNCGYRGPLIIEEYKLDMKGLLPRAIK